VAEILVIDDDPDIRSLLFDTLSNAGYHVRSAADGVSGLASAIELPPDLVLLDWMMPRRSGLEVCLNLRANQEMADIPVVMLTARGTEADIEWGYAAGIDGYIVKPFSPRALVWRVQSMLSLGQQPVVLPTK
jgi:DNA-binding response OmpR family regulator